MRGLLLCGGKGRRIHPLRENKFMLDFLGRPLLLHIVDMLRDVGVDDFVIAGNQANGELLRQVTRELEDVPCRVVLQTEESGMAGGVEAAAQFLDGPVLVVSSNDVVEPAAYRKVVEAVESQQCDVALLTVRMGHHFPGDYLMVDSDMRVRQIVEKPEPGTEPSDLINVVVHFYRDGRRLLQSLSQVQVGSHDRYEAALGRMLGDGLRVLAVPYIGFWGPLKYPWDVLPVMEHFVWGVRRRVALSARVAPSAVVEGAVVLADRARVLEHAVIRGPAYIGERAIVGNSVLVRGGTHIGADSIVGFSTEIKHSYIGQKCWFHSNYIGDSLIDDGCSFGSGAVTANLRFDERVVKVEVDGVRMDTRMDKLGVIMGRGSQVGVNASLMPGVLVGPGAVVGPHVCLTANLSPGCRALARDAHHVEDMGELAPVSAREAMRRKLESI